MNSVNERLRVVVGDITELDVDAVVTAANTQLKGGGGVDGAVHRAAGKSLVEASRKQAPCPTGSAVITPGFALPANHVIHAVGPVYRDGKSGEPELLRSAYHESLKLAEANQLREVAFPCISTGVYGYPPVQACATAVAAVREFLAEHALPETVIFCCFSDRDAGLYRKQLSQEGA